MDYLRDFPKRMKSVGRFAILVNNSVGKLTWRKYGIDTIDKQMNIIFSVLLYVMECSLKDNECTIDDVSNFISMIDECYYKKSYSYDETKELADFIINVILGNSGSMMKFNGYNYDLSKYESINISYIANKIVYHDDNVRRTSYYLTEDGYNMVLSTMELENNLKLTVHEMLFKLHLEKADYKNAVHDIKNVFDQLRIQTKKIQEAMVRIRKNALSYSIEEYKQITSENMETIKETREKFKIHREVIESRVEEYEKNNIDIDVINKKEKDNIDNMKEIIYYLNRSLDEHQKILNEHFDLKSMYDTELENYSNAALIKRFNIRTQVYDRILDDVSLLENVSDIYSMLMYKQSVKIYNLNKAYEKQMQLRNKAIKDEEIQLGFDEEKFRIEQEKRQKEKLEKYRKSLTILVSHINKGSISLKELSANLSKEELSVFVPSVEIFREIMVELISEKEINIDNIKKEMKDHLITTSYNFELNEMLVDIIEKGKFKNIHSILIEKMQSNDIVVFENIKNSNNDCKRIKCSNIMISTW